VIVDKSGNEVREGDILFLGGREACRVMDLLPDGRVKVSMGNREKKIVRAETVAKAVLKTGGDR
jgi:hypothetical protein